jgi:hypothetical protein
MVITASLLWSVQALAQSPLPNVAPGTITERARICNNVYCSNSVLDLKNNVAIEASSSGVIGVLQRTGPGTWVGTQAIFRPDKDGPPRGPPNAEHHDFGAPVALEGRVLLVSGGSRVFVFTRPGETWNHFQTLELPQPAGLYRTAPLDIAMHEGTAVIVARHWSATSTMLQMHVYTRRTGERFVYRGLITPTHGRRLALQRDTLITIDPAADQGRGAVYVYRRTDKRWWAVTQKLAGSHTHPGDDFGRSYAFDRDTIVVSAPKQANPVEPWLPGAVYTFTQSGGAFTQQDMLYHEPFVEEPPWEPGVEFGDAVALSGERLLVDSGLSIGDPPLVTLYERRNQRWIATAKLGCLNIRDVLISGNRAMLTFGDFSKPGSSVAAYELPPLGATLPPVSSGCE